MCTSEPHLLTNKIKNELACVFYMENACSISIISELLILHMRQKTLLDTWRRDPKFLVEFLHQELWTILMFCTKTSAVNFYTRSPI